MKDTEFHNLYKVAKSRDITPKGVAENLISNGRQIYLHFIEEVNGIIEFEGFNKVEDPATYKIKPGKVYPLTPDSRIDLVKALSQKRKQKELKIRIIWEDNENNGYFIIKVKTKLKSMLVIDYEDLKFLPPPPNIEGGITVSDASSRAKFFSDNYFHQLVLRTMKKEGSHWNIVKRNLSRHTLEGEKIKFGEFSVNSEGEMKPQIQFFNDESVEPFTVMESTFKKNLTAYRKHLKQITVTE